MSVNFMVVKKTDATYNPDSPLWALLGLEARPFFCVNETDAAPMAMVTRIAKAAVAAAYSQLSEDAASAVVPAIPGMTWEYSGIQDVALQAAPLPEGTELTKLDGPYYAIQGDVIDALVDKADLTAVVQRLMTLNDGINTVYLLGGTWQKIAFAKRRVVDGKASFKVNVNQPHPAYMDSSPMVVDGVVFDYITMAILLNLGVNITIGDRVGSLLEWQTAFQTALIKNDLPTMVKMAYRSALVKLAKAEKAEKHEAAFEVVDFDVNSLLV